MSVLQICYHGNCFDGAMSAAIFTRFFQDVLGYKDSIKYRAMGHSKNDPFGDDHAKFFSADINAVVDFRYSPSPRLDWWCDHHGTTFLTEEYRRHFENHPNRQHHLDATAPSCSGLLARWLNREFGFSWNLLPDHIYWADIIDSANFTSAQQAVELTEPALQLMMLLDAQPGPELCNQLIAGFAEGSIAQVHARPQIQALLAPMMSAHQRVIELFRQRMIVKDQVSFVDLSTAGVDGFNKFIPYYLRSEILYSVVLTHSDKRTKISVGSNPWNPPDLVDLGALCQKHGGGGHARVGGITLPAAELAGAQEAAQQIREHLAAALLGKTGERKI